MKQPVKINNIIFDRSRILWVQYDPDDSRTVRVRFDDGKDVIFQNDEAMDVWKEFDDEKSYQDE